ncbi:hypothetical protein ACLB2K_072932 [Fragaria x ananassa]
MSHKGLIYSFVAKGSVVLAEHTSFSGNFSTIAVQCLQKLPSSSTSVMLQVLKMKVHIRSLTKMKMMPYEDRFSIAYNLDREFGPKLKEHMQYCMEHPEEMCKLSKLKAQITEVKGVMMDNIEKVLDRGVKIELLVDKSENLQFQLPEARKAIATQDVAAESPNEANDRRRNLCSDRHTMAYAKEHRFSADHCPLAVQNLASFFPWSLIAGADCFVSMQRSSAGDGLSLPGRTLDVDRELPLAGGLAEYQFAAEIDVVRDASGVRPAIEGTSSALDRCKSRDVRTFTGLRTSVCDPD